MAEPFVHLTLRLPRSLVDTIDLRAGEQRLSRSEWIRDALRAGTERDLYLARLEVIKSELVRAIDSARDTVVHHVTREIDDLVQR